MKKIFFLLLVFMFIIVKSQFITVIDNKGTIKTVDNSKWTLSGTNIYNKNTGNIGIGTTTPLNKLEITHGTVGNSGLRFTNLTSSIIPTIGASKFLSVDANGDVVLRNVGENIIDFSVNTDPNTAGTTFNPNQPSDPDVVYISTVDNSSWKWNGITYVPFTPTSTSWLQGGNTLTSIKTLGTKSNHDLPFITNNTERMRITSGGRIGIGTNAPSSGVHIVGQNDGNADDLRLSSYGAGPGAAFIIESSRGSLAAPVNLNFNDQISYFGFRGRVNGGFSDLSTIRAEYKGNGTTLLSNLFFATSGTERMRIDENGNIGIGTFTPNTNAILDVNSTTKGMKFPNLTLTSTTATAPLSAHVAGMTVYNTATVNDVNPGMYINDGTKWQAVNVDNKLIVNELIFEETNYYYVSMKLNSSSYLVTRYNKNDPNQENIATGTGAQPSTLAACQALTY